MKSKALSIILLAASVGGMVWSSTAASQGGAVPLAVAAVSMLVGIVDIVLFAASTGTPLSMVLAGVISVGLVVSAVGVATIALNPEQAGEVLPEEEGAEIVVFETEEALPEEEEEAVPEEEMAVEEAEEPAVPEAPEVDVRSAEMKPVVVPDPPEIFFTLYLVE